MKSVNILVLLSALTLAACSTTPGKVYESPLNHMCKLEMYCNTIKITK